MALRLIPATLGTKHDSLQFAEEETEAQKVPQDWNPGLRDFQ